MQGLVENLEMGCLDLGISERTSLTTVSSSSNEGCGGGALLQVLDELFT